MGRPFLLSVMAKVLLCIEFLEFSEFFGEIRENSMPKMLLPIMPIDSPVGGRCIIISGGTHYAKT